MITYLQLLILIDYDDIPKRIKCNDEIYVWYDKDKSYIREFMPLNLSTYLSIRYNDSYMASVPCIEVIEQ